MKKAFGLLIVIIAAVLLVKSFSGGEFDPEKQVEIINSLSKGLVIVEYTLCYDKNKAPSGADTTYICPNCSRPHTKRVGDELIKQERPLEEAGFLVSPTKVVTRDITMQSRFIKSIKVRKGDSTVNAKIVSYAIDQNAAVLELEKELEGTDPIEFTKSSDKPTLTVNYEEVDSVWSTTIRSLPVAVSVSSEEKKFVVVSPPSLAVNKNGDVAGLIMNTELPDDETWKQSPLEWKMISADELDAKLKALEVVANKSLLSGVLKFRSPRAKPGSSRSRSSSYYSSSYTSINKDTTEEHGIGVNIGGKNILMLIDLSRDITGRLESIRLTDLDGEEKDYSFVGSMLEYGVLVVSAEEPVGEKITFADEDILDLKNKLLLTVELKVEGDQRIVRFSHNRIKGYNKGMKKRVYPMFNGKQNNTFFFNLDNELVVLPISMREKVSVRRSSSSYNRSHRANIINEAAGRIAAKLNNMLDNFDLNNIPLGEDDEERVAWMGVELQKMDRDLARENRCSEQTNYGKEGALVTFVYPDSPAEKAGITAGMILLRLVAEDEPKPITVKISESYRSSFNWDSMDRMRPDYFNRIKPPWPSVKNSFNLTLTEIGFGKKYQAEFLDEGKEFFVDLMVMQSPPYYDSAPKFKSEPLGITVRNLTFDTRKYLQKTKEDPGVIVSKVEDGSKVAVSGIRPYEVITHVNGKPVVDVDKFAEMLNGDDELMFSVDRMSQTRQVRIKQENGKEKEKGEDEAVQGM